MNEKICCFTGHRVIERKHLGRLQKKLYKLLREKYDEGFRVFRAGGALGFDTLAALSVLDLRRDFPDVKLELKLPCHDQTSMWKDADIEIYNSILSRADSVEYAEPRYTNYCMHKRNRMLVNGAHCCIAYYNGSGSGGTRYTCNYASEHGVEIINVWDTVSFGSFFG